MMRALVIVAMLAPFVGVPERSWAISREADIVRDLGEIFKAPSAFPPNPALRPSGSPEENGERTIAPLGPDLGPPEDQPPELLPERAYPFLVALVGDRQSPQETFVCTGTRIAPQWVVTAAHCTFAWERRWPVDPRPVALFDTLRLSQPGTGMAVTKIVRHPDYDARSLRNDIALVRIDAKEREVGPSLKLEGPPIAGQVGQIAFIAGWGVTNLSLAKRQGVESQQTVQVAIRGAACFSAGNYPELKGTGAFCASSLLRFHDTCYRFGGGPLILRDAKGERYMAGMVSWSTACPAETNRINAYLDIQHFVPWIKRVIQDNGKGGR
jgi:secreted trypsin-like serine protease